MKALSKEGHPHRIAVNSMSPGARIKPTTNPENHAVLGRRATAAGLRAEVVAPAFPHGSTDFEEWRGRRGGHPCHPIPPPPQSAIAPPRPRRPPLQSPMDAVSSRRVGPPRPPAAAQARPHDAGACLRLARGPARPPLLRPALRGWPGVATARRRGGGGGGHSHTAGALRTHTRFFLSVIVLILSGAATKKKRAERKKVSWSAAMDGRGLVGGGATDGVCVCGGPPVWRVAHRGFYTVTVARPPGHRWPICWPWVGRRRASRRRSVSSARPTPARADGGACSLLRT
jgi:hypothetical protein